MNVCLRSRVRERVEREKRDPRDGWADGSCLCIILVSEERDMKISSLCISHREKFCIVFALLLAALLGFVPFSGAVSAQQANYTVLYNLENADDDTNNTRQDQQSVRTGQAGALMTDLVNAAEFSGKFTGFHLTGTGAEIRGYLPNEDITKPAGTYSEKTTPAFIFAHYETDGSMRADATAYLVNGKTVTGYFDGDEFIPTESPALRADGSSLVFAFFSRDRYAISLRAYNEADPRNPVLSTGDGEIPQLPADPFIIKNGEDLYERLTMDDGAGPILRYFSAHEPSYGDELQWTWWARWKGTTEDGSPKYEIDPGNQFIGGRSRNKPIDPRHTGTTDLMEGPAYGLKDGDASTLEMWKRTVKLYGINYTFYEDGKFHEPFDENGLLNENVKEEVIFGYHSTDGFYKEVRLNTHEKGYKVTSLEASDQETGETGIVEPVEYYESKELLYTDPDNMNTELWKYVPKPAEQNGSTASFTINKTWDLGDYSGEADSLIPDKLDYLNNWLEVTYTYLDPGEEFCTEGNCTYSFSNWKENEGNYEGESNEVIPGKTRTISCNISELNNGNWKMEFSFDLTKKYAYPGRVPDYFTVTEKSTDANKNYKFTPQTVTLNKPDRYSNDPIFPSGSFTNTLNTISVQVIKTWNDNDDRYGYRPGSIQVELLADGNSLNPPKTHSIQEDESGNWKYTFEELPRFDSAGNEIKYSVTESFENSDRYEQIIDEINNGVINLSNNYNPMDQTISIRVEKIWQGDKSSNRPDSVTVALRRKLDGQPDSAFVDTGATLKLNAGNDWKGIFRDFRMYASNGALYIYDIREVDPPEGYKSNILVPGLSGSYINSTITNTYVDIKVAITKVWDDGDNRDVFRPERVFVLLYDDAGSPVRTSYVEESNTGSAGEDWTVVFRVPKNNAAGDPITYSAGELYLPAMSKYEETENKNYNSDVYDQYFKITNTYTPEEIEVPVSKVWKDDNDRDRIRPNKVVFQLTADGVEVPGKTLELTPDGGTEDDNIWEGKFTGLFKYKNVKGKRVEIQYSVLEKPGDNPGITGYAGVRSGTMATGYVWTNTHNPEQRPLTITKTWDDAGNESSRNAETLLRNLVFDIDDNLYRIADLSYDATAYTFSGVLNGTAVTGTVSMAGNTWTIIVNGMPKYKFEAGEKKEIVYKVNEALDGYYVEALSNNSMTNGFSFTNHWNTTKIKVCKTWNDAGHTDARGNVNIYLHGDDGSVQYWQLTGKTNECHTFDNLPVYASKGSVITYTVREDKVPNYIGMSPVKTVEQGLTTYTIENVYDEGHALIHVSKEWLDDGNRDGKRPTELRFNIFKQVGSGTKDKAAELVLSNSATYGTYGPVDITDQATGDTITWSVEEVVPTEYAQPAEYNPQLDTYRWVFRNQRAIETVAIRMTKTWDDNDNLYDLRGDQPLKLLKRLRLIDKTDPTSTVEYSLVGLTADPDNPSTEAAGKRVAAYPVDYNYTASVDGNPVTVTVSVDALNSWTVTISGVPKNRGGQPIEWSLNENPDTYDFTVESADAPSGIAYAFIGDNFLNMTRGVLTKNWTGNSAPDDPDAFLHSIKLFADGDYFYHGSFTRTGTGKTGDNKTYWTYSISAHPDVVVTIVENSKANWTVIVDKLPRRINGQTVQEWTVTEELDGFDPVINGLTITNIPKSYLPVTKTTEEKDGTFRFYIKLTGGDPVAPSIDGAALTQVSGTNDTWEFVITTSGYSGSVDIKVPFGYAYEVWEVDANGSKVAVGGSPADGWKLDSQSNTAGTAAAGTQQTAAFKNVPTKIDVTITKIWDDADNQDNVRRSGITYLLRQEGDPDPVAVYTSTNDDDFKEEGGKLTNTWSHTFENLPEYCGTARCVYYVVEPQTPLYYTQSYKTEGGVEDKLTIINSHTPAVISVEGYKTWIDNDNRAGKRPESIVITLMKNGVKYVADGVTNPKTIDADTKEYDNKEWSWKWANLPQFEAGNEISWSVSENTVVDYQTTYPSGYNVANTYNEGTKTITVRKVWEDDRNRDNKRPTYVFVDLYADCTDPSYESCTAIDSKALADANNWRNSFTDLPIYKPGQTGVEIVYTVKEHVAVPGYTVSISPLDTGTNTYTMTNTHEPETVEVEGYKTWVKRNMDPDAPEMITIYLYADGEPVEGKVKEVHESSQEIDGKAWSWKWKKRFVKAAGR